VLDGLKPGEPVNAQSDDKIADAVRIKPRGS